MSYLIFLCQLFSVHRSSYKYWRDEAVGETPNRIVLKEKVREAFEVLKTKGKVVMEELEKLEAPSMET